MAVAYSSAGTDRVLRTNFFDAQGHNALEEWRIDPAQTDANLTTFYAALDAATRAGIGNVSSSVQHAVTGQKANATNAGDIGVSSFLAMVFQMNTANSRGKKLRIVLRLPLANTASVNGSGDYVAGGDANVDAVIAFLAAHYQYLLGYTTGTPNYATGMTFLYAKFSSEDAEVGA